jgi:hypothetical protein
LDVVDGDRSPYEILGVDENATADEIDEAWHRRLNDERSGDAAVVTAEEAGAYSLLSDPARRHEYDMGRLWGSLDDEIEAWRPSVEVPEIRPPRARCQAYTSEGRQCRLSPQSGSAFCHLHGTPVIPPASSREQFGQSDEVPETSVLGCLILLLIPVGLGFLIWVNREPIGAAVAEVLSWVIAGLMLWVILWFLYWWLRS